MKGSRTEVTEHTGAEITAAAVPDGIVVIGCSAGGLHALQTLVRSLEGPLPVPLAAVQHRGGDPESRLCDLLRKCAPFPVVRAEDKMRMENGTLYMAPPDYHLLVDDGFFALSIDEPVQNARPSVDVLFESAAGAFGNRTVAVVLTGGNADGAAGAAAVEAAGGTVMVQDPRTAENPAMPEAAVHATGSPRIMPLERIGTELNALRNADFA